MKLTVNKLRQIIREEVENTLKEAPARYDARGYDPVLASDKGAEDEGHPDSLKPDFEPGRKKDWEQGTFFYAAADFLNDDEILDRGVDEEQKDKLLAAWGNAESEDGKALRKAIAAANAKADKEPMGLVLSGERVEKLMDLLASEDPYRGRAWFRSRVTKLP